MNVIRLLYFLMKTKIDYFRRVRFHSFGWFCIMFVLFVIWHARKIFFLFQKSKTNRNNFHHCPIETLFASHFNISPFMGLFYVLYSKAIEFTRIGGLWRVTSSSPLKKRKKLWRCARAAKSKPPSRQRIQWKMNRAFTQTYTIITQISKYYL